MGEKHNYINTAKEPSKENFLTRFSIRLYGCLSDDFAAVDVREELCYHSRPKKRKFKRFIVSRLKMNDFQTSMVSIERYEECCSLDFDRLDWYNIRKDIYDIEKVEALSI